METIYFRANSKEELITDIRQIFPKYEGETEYSDGVNQLHYIGDLIIKDAISNAKGEIIEQPIFIGKQHLNVLLIQQFKNDKDKLDFFSKFKTMVEKPNTPRHLFA
jgi:hypothetical protein